MDFIRNIEGSVAISIYSQPESNICAFPTNVKFILPGGCGQDYWAKNMGKFVINIDNMYGNDSIVSRGQVN